MICKNCFYHPDCTVKPTSEDRCNVFLKKTKVDMSDNVSINPMDTTQFTYDDLKGLLEDTDIDIDDL